MVQNYSQINFCIKKCSHWFTLLSTKWMRNQNNTHNFSSLISWKILPLASIPRACGVSGESWECCRSILIDCLGNFLWLYGDFSVTFWLLLTFLTFTDFLKLFWLVDFFMTFWLFWLLMTFLMTFSLAYTDFRRSGTPLEAGRQDKFNGPGSDNITSWPD